MHEGFLEGYCFNDRSSQANFNTTCLELILSILGLIVPTPEVRTLELKIQILAFDVRSLELIVQILQTIIRILVLKIERIFELMMRI